MLIHHWRTDMGDMYLYKEGKSSQIKVAWLWHNILYFWARENPRDEDFA